MPNRILRDWTDSEAVESLPWQSEVFFTRLIMKVDDFGRFSANPKLLRSLLFPIRDGVRDSDISRDLSACEKAGLIAVYESEGKHYLQIVKFGNTPRAKTSKFPSFANNLQASASKCLQMLANAPVTVTVTGTEYGTETECGTGGERTRASGFPTVVEAVGFAEGQNLPTDQVENWHSNREAQGWVRGNGIAITNWQADLRTWINREARGEFKPSQKGKTNGNHDHRTDKRAREFAESILVPDLN